MLVARLHDNDNGEQTLLILLEPANIAKLQINQPIVKALNEFLPELPEKVELVIGYCPDMVFLAERIKAGVSLQEALTECMGRKEVYSHPEQAEEIERLI
jgi:hypothetical protein